MRRSLSKRDPRSRRFPAAGARPRRPLHPFRRSRLESLEPRWVLSAPTLAAIGDLTEATGTPLLSGAPMFVPLDALDADAGDTITFTVTSSNPNVTTYVPQGNRSMRISVRSADGAIEGDMVFELFEDLVPEITSRIIELAQKSVGEGKFYDDVIFHRVIDGFMIQTGGYRGTAYIGGSVANFDDQFHPDLQHTSAGVLSMAKTSSDDSNSCQFFITDAPTRWLDFQHSVFGRLVEGEDIRNAISNAATGSDTEPDVAITIESVEIFTDNQNGVLMLKAAQGYTGEADITVIASDGNGGQAGETVHVVVLADTNNNYPFLQPVSTVQMDAGQTANFTLGATDVEGDSYYFDAAVSPTSSDLSVTVNKYTGAVTVTASATAGGVYGLKVGVSSSSTAKVGDSNDSTMDKQFVPVLVTPAAPSSIDLLDSSDTGSSRSDNLTTLNNTTGNVLMFRVNGVAVDATVTLYADGHQIGQTVATSNSVVILTTGVCELVNGAHQITAVQGFYNETIDVGNGGGTVTLKSEESAALTITVDRSAPLITSQPVTEADSGVPYVYDVQSDAESAGEASYRLSQCPSGMLINAQTGYITWTPASTHGADQPVTVVVADAAGNETLQSFEIQINRAPQIWAIGNKQIQEGSVLTFEVIAGDPDPPQTGAVIAFSLDAGAPAGAAINQQTGVFTWTPTEAQGPGSYDVWIRATDDGGATSTERITITVTEKNEPPTVNPIAAAIVDEGQLLDVAISATDPDLPANALTYSLAAGSPAGAAIDPATGRFTWRPGEQCGDKQFEITVVVTDSGGLAGQQTLRVTVNEVDNSPVLDPPIDVLDVQPGNLLTVTATLVDPDDVGNAIRYSLEPGSPEGVTIDASTGRISWQVPVYQPAGSIYLNVRGTEVLGDGTLGLSSVATLEVRVAECNIFALDQALSLSTTPTLEVLRARQAIDSLLFDSVRTIRFIPTPRIAAAPQPLLGYRIGTDGGGGSPVEKTKSEKDEGVKPASAEQEKSPADTSKKPKSKKPANEDDDSHDSRSELDPADDSTELAELAPRELLDAAMQELADEAAAAAVDEALAAE